MNKVKQKNKKSELKKFWTYLYKEYLRFRFKKNKLKIFRHGKILKTNTKKVDT